MRRLPHLQIERRGRAGNLSGHDTLVGIDETKLWSMADALRNNMDAAEYKHVVLGLIFLKYIDAFENTRNSKHSATGCDRGASGQAPVAGFYSLLRCLKDLARHFEERLEATTISLYRSTLGPI